MAAASRRSSGPVLRTLSPAGRFRNSRPSPATTAFASSTSTFSARSTAFFQNRSSSPTRDNLYGSSSGSVPSVRFGSITPNSSISVAGAGRHSHHQKRTCMCSPTSHPGSFRCSLHKSFGSRSAVAAASPNRLNARRSAMTNSLVRIRGVEGELVKRALAALIRPSSHQQRRRGDFRPRPSRLSIMFTAKD
ncbi:hypothetical protein AAZX31_15G188700 [Glycine max]|uniref:Serine-rich protein n=2 Tax=Glycine subgen. Soja TaxID=1462606 RepID=I1MHX7_SOYBN|nr:uncharacterized protein LOC100806199 [Glycine max]XP_028202659.1 uncharacterized protein LOC114386804 [Glycine soja]KAG4949739.1 hypothetical protein JHK86_042978 [Glycine max]KAG5117060.1 hypothetical protein JHK84_043173 [Glycine max]KAH1209962.1 hypothetical protein GmHk_15G044357 [Glycine max]KRH12846.1 hypothetical protein GLYMA_15G198900v4 [Glycine max]RZB65403.1 hypothetical protein D0Y65_041454 [Glycine soja]|eukprot:XP_003546585.1 uncharacterized protein LOC100806199 [Glycine max]